MEMFIDEVGWAERMGKLSEVTLPQAMADAVVALEDREVLQVVAAIMQVPELWHKRRLGQVKGVSVV